MVPNSNRNLIKKYLNSDNQKKKMDSLLLHTSTLLGIVLALSQTMINPKYLLTSFIPLFLFIWLIPIYIGYVKGAIVYDLISERLRGWIYLIGGTFTYLLFLGVFFLRTKPKIPYSLWDNYIIVGILILIVLFENYFLKKSIKFFDTQISNIEKYIIRRTTILPIFLGFSALLYLIMIDVEINNIGEIVYDIGYYVGVGVIVALIIIVFFVESRNKKIIKKLDEFPCLIDKKPFTADSIILIIAFVISLIVLLLSIYILYNFMITFIFLFVVLILMYILLFRFLFYNKKIVYN